MKSKFLTLLLFGLSTFGLFTSCIEDEVEALGDKGQTFIKINEAPLKNIYFLPFTDVRKVDVFNLRRDVNSSSKLNASQAIKLVAAPELITAYNNDNKTNFQPLPESFYTLTNNPSIQKTNDGYIFNFGSGDFAKDLTIMLDGSKWTDLGNKYALAFKITDTQGDPIAAKKESVFVTVSIQNKYAGTYKSSGTFNHPTAGPRAIDRLKELVTVNTNTVETEYADLGGAGYKMWLQVNADNTVTIIGKGATPATHSQFGVNVYDPATQSFTLNYKYPGGGGERVITETIKKK